jgi:uncharacterized protein YjbI with pentapeptide repeats
VSRADYHVGLTIEAHESPLKLAIDGRPVEGVTKDEAGLFSVSEYPDIKATTLYELGKEIIDHSPELKDARETIRDNHYAILKQGVEHWNNWRRTAPSTRPLLFGLDLRKEALGLPDLNSVDFANANLIESKLMEMSLIRANFHEANLGGADLFHADLTEANFCRTDLYRTNLSDAILHGANLQGTQLAMTNLTGSKLKECRIYGIGAWDITVDDATRQEELVILYKTKTGEGEFDESQIIVPNLDLAQFVYLLLCNQKIRDAVDTITSKVVLILGRFTPERKSVLDRVRAELCSDNQYVPILFDFIQPRSKDLTDTVTLLAQMSLFVIADLTDPSCSPYELKSVYDATKVPIQSIILKGKKPFAMFWDLRNASRDRVLAPFTYSDPDHLIHSLRGSVIQPLLAAGEGLRATRERTEKERIELEKEQDLTNEADRSAQ